MCISVVIPTFGRPGKLPDAIKSVLNEPKIIQVIVVIDGNSEEYQDFITKNKNNERIQFIADDIRRFSAGARNLGIEHCKGKYILFIDDDIILEPDFVKNALKTMDEFKCDAVGGCVLLPQHNHINKPFFDWKTLKVRSNSSQGPEIVPYTTTITLWKRWVFDKGVRFPFYKINGYREESDLGVQALKLNAIIVYEPNCISRHDHQNYGGGQWSKGKLKWYFYSIYNNYLFLNKHYKFLKDKYSLKKPLLLFCFYIAIRNLTLFIPINFKKMLRKKK